MSEELVSEEPVSEEIRIPARFHGPPGSSNGGWASGALARRLDGPAQVTLRRPPPLDTPLRVVRDGDGAALYGGDTLVAEATPRRPAVAVPAPVAWEEAAAAVPRFVAYEAHPYPGCFVCGPERADDGLRVFPGPVAGRRVAAAPFEVPAELCEDGLARPELCWALLDCPSWYGYTSFHQDHGRILLGRLTAEVRERPEEGARCVVGGWAIRREGRKFHCGSALWRADGRGVDRGRLSASWKGKRLGRTRLEPLASIVTPQTIFRWYRRLVARGRHEGERRGAEAGEGGASQGRRG